MCCFCLISRKVSPLSPPFTAVPGVQEPPLPLARWGERSRLTEAAFPSFNQLPSQCFQKPPWHTCFPSLDNKGQLCLTPLPILLLDPLSSLLLPCGLYLESSLQEHWRCPTDRHPWEAFGRLHTSTEHRSLRAVWIATYTCRIHLWRILFGGGGRKRRKQRRTKGERWIAQDLTSSLFISKWDGKALSSP